MGTSVTILDQLDRLCAQFPACNVVAYTDLTTGMVLGSGSRQRPPQEQLDHLCQTAADLLDICVGQGLVQTAIMVDGDTVGVFLRSAGQPTEALCCDCTTAIDIAAFANAATAALTAIVAGP
jgi:hypothetical protein